MSVQALIGSPYHCATGDRKPGAVLDVMERAAYRDLVDVLGAVVFLGETRNSRTCRFHPLFARPESSHRVATAINLRGINQASTMFY
jgi:hypothetical protein